MRILPIVPLRGTVLFPNNVGHFDIGRPKSIAAFKFASAYGGLVVFATQTDDSNAEPKLSDLKEVGTLAKILSVNVLPNASIRVVVEGKKRVRILRGNDENAIRNDENKLNEKDENGVRKNENKSDENDGIRILEEKFINILNEIGVRKNGKMSDEIRKNENKLDKNSENEIQKSENKLDESGVRKDENNENAIRNDENKLDESGVLDNEKIGVENREKTRYSTAVSDGQNRSDKDEDGENSDIPNNNSERNSDITNNDSERNSDIPNNDAERDSSIPNEDADGMDLNIPNFLSARVEDILSTNENSFEADAFRRGIYLLLDEYAILDGTLRGETVADLKALKSNGALIDKTAPFISLKDPYPILAETDTVERFKILSELLSYENEVLTLDKKLHIKIRHSLDKAQKEHIMREQMRAISEELGNDSERDAAERIAAMKAPDEIKNKLLKENARIKRLSATSPEFSIITEYTEFALELPWNGASEEIRDLSYAKMILDRDHYGLKNVKERILEYIAVHKLTDAFKSPVLCFVGPPGVGKTSIAKSIAEATGRKFVRMSLGGVSDEAEIRGHRKTYVAAMAGRILNGIKIAGTSNPVFLLDEIDKLSKSNKGDPSSALLEVLDPEQNSAFRDNYLEMPYDLSKVMFLTTANTIEGIPEPLLDRMEIVKMPSYTYEEKFHIAKNHLVKKEMQNHGLTEENIEVEDGTIYEIISKYTSEPGVRELQRQIAKIMRKTAYITASGGEKSTARKENLAEFLGNKTVLRQKIREKDEVGVVTGLAWTSSGGDILPIEINTVKGKGNIITTGNLRDIIKESIKVALTYIHSAAEKYGIREDAFTDLDYHIHLPETSVPKEGPSAGAGFAAAIYSALTKKTVRRDAALTGEISLRGNISAVGGVKEKIMSGARAGIKIFFIPKDNMPDIEEIPSEIADKIKVVPISHFDDLIKGGEVFSDVGHSRSDAGKSDEDSTNARGADGRIKTDSTNKERSVGKEDFKNDAGGGLKKEKTHRDGNIEDFGKDIIIDQIEINRIFGN
jgi:ATP-dependent Lon protease